MSTNGKMLFLVICVNDPCKNISQLIINIKSLRKSVWFLLLLFVLFPACKKDDINPEYVGRWATTMSITINNVPLQIRDLMTFTKDGFDEVMQIFDISTSRYINYVELSGTMTVNGNILNGWINEIGLSTFDLITGKPTGQIVTYREGTTGYDNFFIQNGQSKSYVFKFSISGNSLTIMTDNNGDGDYNDDNETIIYTRR